MKNRLLGGLALVCTAAAAAQPLAFEVATVKSAAPRPSVGGPAPPPPPSFVGIVGDRVNLTDMSLRLLITMSYRLKDYQVVAPDWMATARFDVSAKMPKGSTRDEAFPMLQALLEERFKLSSHHEQRDMTAYALVAAKNGPKLTEPANPTPGLRFDPQRGNHKLTGDAPLAVMANMLSLQLDRPVTDQTGLSGTYRIELSWTPGENERNYVPSDASGPSLFTALEETLGLKLDPRKTPMDMLVIDRAERTPAAN